METIKLCIAALLPVVFSVFFYLLEKKTSFKNASKLKKQIYIGIAFGMLAIFSTQFSVAVNGANTNARDCAPLCAGLIFGAPAGIIAGVMGGVFRFLATLWGVGAYTRLACSIATILAGVIGALLRSKLFDNKKPAWFYGIAIGVATEILHMLMIFFTHMDDIEKGFSFIQKCAPPMIILNTISLSLALLIVSIIGKRNKKLKQTKLKISQSFQRYLLLCVLIAFFCTSIFTYIIQNKTVYSSAESLMQINIQDVKNNIDELSDKNLVAVTKKITKEMEKEEIANKKNINGMIKDKKEKEKLQERLEKLAKKYNVSEISIINKKGIISISTYDTFIGFDMNSGEQSKEFIPLLDKEETYVQSYQPTTYDTSIKRKYAGVALKKGGFVQVGYNAEAFHKDLYDRLLNYTKNRHIGRDGYMIIATDSGSIISDRKDHKGKTLKEIGLEIDPTAKQNTRYEGTIHGIDSYYTHVCSEGYIVLSIIPKNEVLLSRNISVYVSVFMQIIVFSIVFVQVFFLIKRLVVDNMNKVNHSLDQITDGNLDVVVDVRSNEEFISLSDDINSTVTTLKHYIEEAEARIDKELEFAKNIQHSVLPNVFPPFPHRNEFSIWASMNTAKEVGGDFYDFYFINHDTLVILMADVSGKGIPAAMFMMTAKATIKSFAESGRDVNDVFTYANAKLCEGNDANMFVTAWIGFVNVTTGLVEYANAGHNPPVVKHKNGSFEYVKSPAGLVLAGMDGLKYKKNELQLNEGDIIYLYTDGVTEANDIKEELYGEDRLVKALNSVKNANPETICKEVKADLDKFVGDAEQFDDITMLCLKLN